jgi:hypothetical protein
VGLVVAAGAMETTSELGRAALEHRGKETLAVLAVQMETFLAAAAAVAERVQLVPMGLEVLAAMAVQGPHLQLQGLL